MKTPTHIARYAAVFFLFLAACEKEVPTTETPVVERDTIHYTVVVSPVAQLDSTSFLDPTSLPVTLPVLDAFMQDSTFVAELRDSLQLNDQQLTELRRIAREEGGRIGNEVASTDSTMEPGTMGARLYAMHRISSIIGPDKTWKLGSMIRSGWEGTPPAGIAMGPTPNVVPSDTRIVINAPSFRMDLFENGQLVKTYSIASGYPEFPLPSGMRTASEIIYNPSWTPP
ncbi:MAG: L,D-transpeptidase family protein, partial [bacterium]|nr:L,D-transpeptidase family protein [Candidatus Kapabacteria bacterium]